MNKLLKLVSLVALAAIVVPSLLCFTGALEHNAAKWLALLATIVWFAVTPLWMGRKRGKMATRTQEAAE
ncbi:MAG: AzlD domain-containing protein [Planctomycetes bacterium]|nr:AzlD domain-containing protein [Planctomycetota bacterium]MBL7039738.1 AzlD domain-containing protein [Pirellulaceae bacterium]